MATKNTFKYIRAAYDKYRRGDSLTNHEMRALQDHLEGLAEHLAPLRDMSIVHRAVLMDLAPIRGYVEERSRRHLRSVS